MTVEELNIVISANDRKFNEAIGDVIGRLDDLEEQSRRSTDDIGNFFTNLGHKLAALGIGKIIGDSIMSGGELEQQLGGVEVVFSEHAESMRKAAATAYKDMGLSESDYLAKANKMGALLKGSGFDTGYASAMSQQVMQRASDVASIMGVDVKDAMEAVTGAAKGNFTMMDNLGVAMNDTTLQAYAQEKGLGKLETTQQKVSAAMQMFLDKTEYAAGNYARENDTFSGSLTTAKAQLENMTADLGTQLLPTATSLLTMARGGLEAISPLVVSLGNGLNSVAQYVGMMTASFARISRSNELEFVPLTCERNDGGVIVPVREIAGNIRFNTDFSDDTTCIAKLFTRRNGAAVYSTREISAGGSEKLAVMELNENPLLAELSDDVVAAVLNNELLQMYKCLNRVFDSSFTGDPALEIGDYVRLRGGAIDTDRGYATGMITSQIWRYRGQHTIKCSMPSSLSAVGETEVQTLALDDSSSDITAPPVRTQPKSQLQKQIDELRKQLSKSGGTAEKLQTTGSKYWAITDDSGVSFGTDDSGKIAYLTKQGTGTGFRLGAYGSTGMEFKGSGLGKIRLYDQSDGNCYLYVESGAEFPINICTSDNTSQGDHTSFQVYNGGKLKVYPDSLTIQTESRTTLTLKITSDGWSLGTMDKLLEAKSDGLYFNGKKVLLEG